MTLRSPLAKSKLPAELSGQHLIFTSDQTFLTEPNYSGFSGDGVSGSLAVLVSESSYDKALKFFDYLQQQVDPPRCY